MSSVPLFASSTPVGSLVLVSTAPRGFSDAQLETGLLSGVIGNTYAGASPVGLTAILDIAQPGERILMVSYGSGAGSDALDLRVTENISKRRNAAPSTADYIARRVEIDYATYARYRGILRMD